MTVTYTSEVTTCKGIGGCFLKLLTRWKGSVYKIVWSDLILYLFIYYTLNLSYYYVLSGTSKAYFEDIVRYAGKNGSLIPLSFVLGFFVDLVMERWWSQYNALPFPDNLAILIGASIKGQDVRSRAVKRTIVRYACATFTITLTMISPKVKKRFPTLNHLIEAGLLTKEEKEIIEDLNDEFPSYAKYWLPIAWASNMVVTARQKGLIREDDCVEKILEELNHFRDKCGALLDYDWISVPLVYTQVVTIAVYSYFLISVVGNQHISENGENIIGSYFPLIPVLEFFFYMGWLKVAETLTNPFGDDDDDFEVIWMVDRHLQVVYLLVDRIPQRIPKLTKDVHWDEMAPVSLPYTQASRSYMQEYPLNSTKKLTFSNEDQEIIMPELSKLQTSFPGREDSTDVRRPHILRCAGFPLRNVSTEGCDEVDEGIPENDVQEEEEHPYCDTFEILRKKRLEEHQERLQAMISSIETRKSK